VKRFSGGHCSSKKWPKRRERRHCLVDDPTFQSLPAGTEQLFRRRIQVADLQVVVEQEQPGGQIFGKFPDTSTTGISRGAD